MTNDDIRALGSSKAARHARRSVRAGVATALAAATVFLAGVASADQQLPPFLASYLKMPCTPDCTLCHNDDSGGAANLRMATKDGQSVTAFAPALEADCNLNVLDPKTYQAAFDCDVTKNLDADGDGINDVAELEHGTDPNDPTPGASICTGGGPTYGCARLSPKGSVDGVASAASGAVLVLGLGLMRRRRNDARRR